MAQIHRALVIKFEQNHRTVNPIIKYTVVRRDGGGAGGKNLALGPISRILFHTLRCFDRHFSRARLATDLACVARLHSACTVLRMAKQAAAYPWLLDEPPSHLFCLAPDGVFRAVPLTRGRGWLLPQLFTLTDLQSQIGDLRSQTGGMFSVTLSVDAP